MVSCHTSALLLILSHLITKVVATVDIINASRTFVLSEESMFDHEVCLFENVKETLKFLWNDIRDGVFEGRLVHKASSSDDAPSWLGFGVYDTLANPGPVSSNSSLMIGSEAIIGMIHSGRVQKYNLDDKIAPRVIPEESQTLEQGNILQHLSDNGSVNTDLSFKKHVQETDDEAIFRIIKPSGDNVFLWATGSPGSTLLGYHRRRGAFTVDLDTVKRGAMQGLDGSTIDQLWATDVKNDSELSSVGVSGKGMSGYVDDDDDDFDRDDDDDVDNENAGDTSKNNGDDISANNGSGYVDDDDDDFSRDDDVSSEEQDGEDSNDNDEKIDHSDDKDNDKSNSGSESDETDYSNNDNPPSEDGNKDSISDHTLSRHKNMWIAHGIFAFMAFAIAVPSALFVAWFRLLIPTRWIYYHVFANGIAFIFALISVTIAFCAMSHEDNPHHLSHWHHWLGLALLVIMSYQLMSGFSRPPVEKPDPFAANLHDIADNRGEILPRTPRKIWLLTHRCTGIIVFAFGLYQISGGLILFSQQFLTSNFLVPWYWGYVVSSIFGVIVFKILTVIRAQRARQAAAIRESSQLLEEGFEDSPRAA